MWTTSWSFKLSFAIWLYQLKLAVVGCLLIENPRNYHHPSSTNPFKLGATTFTPWRYWLISRRSAHPRQSWPTSAKPCDGVSISSINLAEKASSKSLHRSNSNSSELSSCWNRVFWPKTRSRVACSPQSKCSRRYTSTSQRYGTFMTKNAAGNH